MSEWLKNTAYLLFILLASTSALFTWVRTDNDINVRLGFEPPSDITASSLDAAYDNFTLKESDTNITTDTEKQTDFFAIIGSALNFFYEIWALLGGVVFGWYALFKGMFSAIGLEALADVFLAPLLAIQMVAVFYFLRDIANTLRGAG